MQRDAATGEGGEVAPWRCMARPMQGEVSPDGEQRGDRCVGKAHGVKTERPEGEEEEERDEEGEEGGRRRRGRVDTGTGGR